MGGVQVKKGETHKINPVSTKSQTICHESSQLQNLNSGSEKTTNREKCENYKQIGHNRANCWFLHPNLSPAHWIEKGEGDRRGQREKKSKEERGRYRKRIKKMSF
jgi:hypothetical protein